MKKTIFAVVVAFLAMIAVPSAAYAYGSDTPTTSPAAPYTPGETVTVTWPAGTFESMEDITVSCSCTAGTATLAPTTTWPTPPPSVFHFSPAPTYFANEDGSFSVFVTLPNVDFGTCNITATGDSSSYVATAALTHTPGGLPQTGANVAPLLWAGSGVILLGVAFVIVFANRRKSEVKN